jgi:hypothetical protein
MGCQKLAHGNSGFQTLQLAGLDNNRFPYERFGAAVAAAALSFESSWTICLRQQHVVNLIDLMLRDIVIAHEQAQVVYVVLPLQLIIYRPQKLAGKLIGFSVAFFTSIVPLREDVARDCPGLDEQYQQDA